MTTEPQREKGRHLERTRSTGRGYATSIAAATAALQACGYRGRGGGIVTDYRGRDVRGMQRVKTGTRWAPRWEHRYRTLQGWGVVAENLHHLYTIREVDGRYHWTLTEAGRAAQVEARQAAEGEG